MTDSQSFSAEEVADFLDAISTPRLLPVPTWWAEFENEPEPNLVPAAPTIDVSPDLAAVAVPSWLGQSPFADRDWPPPPGFARD